MNKFCFQNNCANFQVTSHVNLDVSIEGTDIGRMTIGMFGEVAPKAVKNFQTICTKGIKGRTYSGTKFHRAINRFIIQGTCQYCIV